jgi:hypothetical protein
LSIRIIDNAGTQTVTTAGTFINTAFTDSIFSITLVTGTSNSPGGPATLHLNADVTTQGAPNPALPQDIQILISGDGFLSPAGTAYLEQDVNTNKASLATVAGGADFSGFYKTGSALFDESGLSTGNVNLPDYALRSGTSSSAPGLFVGPYTLTEVITMHFTSAGEAQATANLNAIQVPEPAAVTLLGGILFFTASSLRRRYRRV